MNTRLSIVVPGMEADEGEALAGEVQALLGAQERLMSRFAPDAELARLNRTAAGGPVRVSPALWEVLALCRGHWERTGGAFDIAFGALSDAWRAHRRDPAAGRSAEAAALARCGFRHVTMDPAQRSVGFAVAGLSLDLGGIGKGIALAAVERLLRARHVAHALVSFGESSVLAIGPQPSGADWLVGMADRNDPGRSLHRFALRDASLSTSGQDAAAPHIVDPQDRRAAGGDRILSVACRCPIEADVLSTALLVRAPDERGAMLERYPGLRAVEIGYSRSRERPKGEVVWRHEQ